MPTVRFIVYDPLEGWLSPRPAMRTVGLGRKAREPRAGLFRSRLLSSFYRTYADRGGVGDGLKFTQGSVLVFLTTVIIALALSAGLVAIERYINLMRQRIAKVQKGYGVGTVPAEGRRSGLD
jgi:hypothetical protein